MELSVKLIVNGLTPPVGLAVKFASGKRPPVPLTRPIRLPPLLALKTIELVKLPALVGLKLTITLVELNPPKAKLVTDSMPKGPPTTLTDTLVIGPPPELVATKLPVELLPSTTPPRSSNEVGEMVNNPGVKAVPLTPLVLLPPLLLNTTTLLKEPAFVVVKVTVTTPVWPAPRLKGLPL